MKPWLVSEQHILSSEISRKVLPHALLVSGVSGSGKHELADWLIKLLACSSPQQNLENSSEEILISCGQCKHCRLIASHSYPDHKTLETDNRSISVDEVRIANQFFEKTAQLGEFKTVIVPFAEKMTVAAANALLKTLEEPNGKSLIVLLSEQGDMLLPTIVSRCRKISLRPPTGNSLLGSSEGHRDEPFANLSQIAELSDPKVAEEYEQLFVSFTELLKNKGDRKLLISQLDGNKHASRWLEKISVNFVRQQFGWGSSSIVDSIPKESLWKIHELVVSCNTRLNTLNQANATFEYERLIGDIKRIVIS